MKKLMVLVSLLVSVNAMAYKEKDLSVQVDAGKWASRSEPFGVEVDEAGMVHIKSGCAGGASYDVARMEQNSDHFQVATSVVIGGLSPQHRSASPGLLSAKITAAGNLRVNYVTNYYDEEKKKWETNVSSYLLIRDLERNYPLCAAIR